MHCVIWVYSHILKLTDRYVLYFVFKSKTIFFIWKIWSSVYAVLN